MNSEHILKIENLSCKDVVSHVCENLGEPDDSPLCRAIQSHIKECDGCAQFRKSLFKMAELYKGYSEEMPEEAHDRLIKFLGLPCNSDEEKNEKKKNTGSRE